MRVRVHIMPRLWGRAESEALFVEAMNEYLYRVDASKLTERGYVEGDLLNPNELDNIGSGLTNSPAVGGVDKLKPKSPKRNFSQWLRWLIGT